MTTELSPLGIVENNLKHFFGLNLRDKAAKSLTEDKNHEEFLKQIIPRGIVIDEELILASSFSEEVLQKQRLEKNTNESNPLELKGATLGNIIFILEMLKNNEVTTYSDIYKLVKHDDGKFYPPAVATTVRSRKILPSLAAKVLSKEDISEDKIFLSSEFISHYGYKDRSEYFESVGINIYKSEKYIYALRNKKDSEIPGQLKYLDENKLKEIIEERRKFI